MKRLLIGDSREMLLVTLEIILRHWGYRTLVSSNVPRLTSLVTETTPDLLIFGESLLRDSTAPLAVQVQKRVSQGTPLLLMPEPDAAAPFLSAHEILAVPVDIFNLFEKIQKYLEKHPRRNIRLALELPGMLCMGDRCHLAEVLSLSTRGVFIKTGFRLKKGDSFSITFPLLGLKQEVEMAGRVLYCVRPDPDNNFLQGVGVEFIDPDTKTLGLLESFLESCLLNELPGRSGKKLIAENCLRDGSRKPTLHLNYPAA